MLYHFKNLVTNQLSLYFQNPKNTKWKKKHGRIQDYVDLGDGYDENDEFIDNSEAVSLFTKCDV